jgi:hypothetical protein
MTDNVTFVLQNCTVALSVEHGLCSETAVQSSDDSNEVTTIRIVGELVHIKEEDEPIAISFSSIKEEPEVSPQTFSPVSVIMPFCLLSAFPHNSAPYFKWNCSVYIYTVC